MKYKGSLDLLAKIITIGITVLFVGVGLFSVMALLNDVTKLILMYYGLIILTITTLLGSYLYSPQMYEIRDRQFIIRRPIGPKRINLTDITEIKKIRKEEMAGTIRIFGVGGLFGYIGKFHNSRFGNMTYYLTQRKNMILLKTKNGKKIIISPDDITLADKLEEAINMNSTKDRL